jgi:hypothetical protein
MRSIFFFEFVLKCNFKIKKNILYQDPFKNENYNLLHVKLVKFKIEM